MLRDSMRGASSGAPAPAKSSGSASGGVRISTRPLWREKENTIIVIVDMVEEIGMQNTAPST